MDKSIDDAKKKQLDKELEALKTVIRVLIDFPSKDRIRIFRAANLVMPEKGSPENYKLVADDDN